MKIGTNAARIIENEGPFSVILIIVNLYSFNGPEFNGLYEGRQCKRALNLLKTLREPLALGHSAYS